jgi:hypothetical protein
MRGPAAGARHGFNTWIFISWSLGVVLVWNCEAWGQPCLRKEVGGLSWLQAHFCLSACLQPGSEQGRRQAVLHSAGPDLLGAAFRILTCQS